VRYSGHSLSLFAGVVAVAVFVTAALPVRAQTVSGQVNIRTPGSFTGLRGPSYGFRSRSYGTGALGTSAGAGGSILRSSVSGAANYNFSRPSGQAAAGAVGLGGLPAPAPTGRNYDTGVEGLLKTPGLGSARGQTPQDLSALLAGASYLEAVSSFASPGASEQSAVRSFVPDVPGIYQDLMRKADTAFRRGEYREAADQYRYANHLASRSPETLLGLAHCHLAMESYGTAAWHLKQTLMHFPELPLVPLDPKALYAEDPNTADGEPVRYRQHRLALEEYVKRSSYDANAHLLLTYLLWFENRPDEASKALAEAQKAAEENPSSMDLTGMNLPDPTREAISIFRRGMEASGKLGGPLEAGSQPSTSPEAP